MKHFFDFSSPLVKLLDLACFLKYEHSVTLESEKTNGVTNCSGFSLMFMNQITGLGL